MQGQRICVSTHWPMKEGRKCPLAKTFRSPRFGMLTDRFGVGWMVNVVA